MSKSNRNTMDLESEVIDARRFVQQKIKEIIMMRQQNSPNLSEQRLTDIVRRIDGTLWRGASTTEEYMNLETLEKRLYNFISSLPSSGHNQQYPQRVNSSSTWTMIPTPGMAPIVMDNNSRRSAQDGAESAIDTGDWRTQLQNESRQRIVNKIMDTLKRHLPFIEQEGLLELQKIAIRFEERIYTDATSQSDYLRKISLKMLTMESKSQNSMANSLPSNPADAGSLGMQSQIGNQGPLFPVGQPRQQLLAQNIQYNITATGLQDSSCLTSAMPGGGALPQTSVPCVVQNINLPYMQSISGVSQSSVANSMGQGVSANMNANTQRQMQGRQQALAQQMMQKHQKKGDC